ncbi:MAG: hypothetical protein ACRED9_08255 [Caulobacteraceae bacterium]
MAPSAPPPSGGMPQFDVSKWPGEIFWILVVFGVLYLVLARVLLPRIGGTIEARESHISGEVAEARGLRDQASREAETAKVEMAEARARARKLAEDAAAEAKAVAARRRSAEDARLGEVLAAADARIAVARAEAMSHVRAIAAEAGAAMVQRLTGRPASEAEIASALPSAAAS